MKKIILLTLLLFTFGFKAHAALITFDGESGFANGGSFFDVDNFRFASIDEGGVAPFIFLSAGSPCILECLFNANSSAVLMSRVDGQGFSLSSFDFARRFGDSSGSRSAVFLNLIGTTLTGQVLDVTVNLADGLQTYSSNVFSNIQSLRFSAGALGSNGNPQDREFLLENISVDAVNVPEPSSLALYALTVIFFGASRLKKKA